MCKRKPLLPRPGQQKDQSTTGEGPPSNARVFSGQLTVRRDVKTVCMLPGDLEEQIIFENVY